MTWNTSHVKELFGHLAGEAADETGTEREKFCAALCAQCVRQVQGLVRQEVGETVLEQYQEDLESLAAVQALYQLILADEAVTPQSLTAGDVKLQEGDRSRWAAQLVAEKRRAVSPVLGETDFFFGAVKEGEACEDAQ